MSIKNWKNRELKSLLSEAWGFKSDLTKLSEYATDTVPPTGEKVPPVDEDDDEESLEEMGCGDHAGAPEDMGVMVMDDGEDGAPGMDMPEEGGIQGLAAKAIEAIQALADAAAGTEDNMMDNDMMDNDMMGERGGHELEDPRLREVVRKVLKELNKGK